MPTAINEEADSQEGGDKVEEEAESNTLTDKLMALVWKTQEEETVEVKKPTNGKIGDYCLFLLLV